MPDLDLAVLRGPLPVSPNPGLESDDPRLQRVTYFAGRGDYDEAAAAAQAVFQRRIYDVRLIGAFLAGAFLQDGVVALPDILACATAALGDDYPALGPTNRKAVLADASLGWLFRTLLDLLEFHDQQRDEPWTAWVLASDDALVDRVLDGCDLARHAVKARLKEAACLDELGKLRVWFDDTFRHVVARQSMLPGLTPAEPKAEPAKPVKAPPPPTHLPPRAAPPAQPAAAQPAAAQPPASVPPAPLAAVPPAPGADVITIPTSPALKLLLQKLRAFETLVERGELQKAAIVAHDVRRTVESFDPKVYLPSLFSSYFARLAAHVDELSPHWEGAGSLPWQILEQFYQVDLDAFVGEPKE
ncbi:type VI secretion system protein IglI family protein [Sorangium sp. So ce136]|uniref:type VI secretion system protein IglI family protein n=1 Tax=Sorangium sp. So ce136 TaxID=3133284 RepID=UPI003F09A940